MVKILKILKKVTGILLIISVLFFYSASAEDGITVSLILGESISINFFASENIQKAEISFGGKTETLTPVSEDGKHKFVFSEIGPKMMNDRLTAVFYDGNGEKTAEKSISVKEYLQKISGAESIAQSLLDYGSAAQIYENYNINNFANGKTEEEIMEKFKDTEFSDSDFSVSDSDNMPIRWTGVSAILKDKIILRFYAECKDGFGEYYTYISIGGVGVTLPAGFITTSDTNGYLDVPLKATEINKPVTVFFHKGDKEYKVSPVLAYSLETYACRITQKTQDEKLKALLSSILNYGNEAEAYAESNR